jgi:hypothetical protein
LVCSIKPFFIFPLPLMYHLKWYRRCFLADRICN